MSTVSGWLHTLVPSHETSYCSTILRGVWSAASSSHPAPKGTRMTDTTQCPAIDLATLNSDPDAWSRYRDMRRRSVVSRGEQYGGYWALIGYSAIRDAALDTRRFCSAQGATIPAFGNPLPAVPVEADPPEHREYRRLMVAPLRPDRVKEHADAIRDATVECIDAFIEEGRADLAADLAAHVPPIIIAKILGLRSDDAARFAAWTGEMNRSSSRGDVAANKAAAGALLAFVDEQVHLARGGDRGDLIATIANSNVAGEPLPHETAVGAVIALVVAGHETTVNGIASVLWLLGAHPDIKARLIDDPELIPNAVDEVLRLESPVQMMARTLTEDTEIDGIEMKAGDKVGLVWGGGQPRRVEVHRPGQVRHRPARESAPGLRSRDPPLRR